MGDLKLISADIEPKQNQLVAVWWRVTDFITLFENGYYDNGDVVTSRMRFSWDDVIGWYDVSGAND